MRRMRSGVGRSRSTVKPDGTSDNSELGSRTGHGKENVFCRYGHPSRIIHRAAPKVRKNHHWTPVWLPFSAYAATLIGARVMFGHLPDRIGGGRVALSF